MYYDNDNIEILKGKTLVDVRVLDDEIYFETEDETFKLYHCQDCCENVYVDSVVGDVKDLIGTPLLTVEEVQSDEPSTGDESYTWTFYKLATRKGYVDIRWYGSSNGYYSESVHFARV